MPRARAGQTAIAPSLRASPLPDRAAMDHSMTLTLRSRLSP